MYPGKSEGIVVRPRGWEEIGRRHIFLASPPPPERPGSKSASYPMDNVGCFSQGFCGRDVNLITDPFVVDV